VQAAFSESSGAASASSSATSSGCSACAFSPDSSKLVLATATSSHIVVFDLGDPEARQPRLLRKFDQHRLAGAGRTVRGRTVSVHADGDVNIEATPAGNDDSDEDENMDEEEEAVIGAVTRMTISADGQWLATTDDLCRTHVFNLDALQVGILILIPPSPFSYILIYLYFL
jgi:U3 small nucleolar RNA-associated protein 4